MSTKYKFTDTTATYFATSTVVDWIDVFTREDRKTMVLKNIKSFAALKIIDAIIKNPQESRKDCLPAATLYTYLYLSVLSMISRSVRGEIV